MGRRPKIDYGSEPVLIAPGDTLQCSLTDGRGVYDITVTVTEVTPDGTFLFASKSPQRPGGDPSGLR